MALINNEADPSAMQEKVRRTVAAVAAGVPGAAEELKRLLNPSIGGATAEPQGADTELDLAMVSMVRDVFRRQVAEGRVKPARQQVLTSLLDELETLIGASPNRATSIHADLLWLGRLRELMARAMWMLRDASHARTLPAISRSKVLLTYLEAQQQFLAQEINRPNLATGESQGGRDLFLRLATIGVSLAACADDAAATAVERESLRQACFDVRRYARRRHLTLAIPFWGPVPQAINPNAVFFSGVAAQHDIVVDACRTRDLELLDRTSGREIGRARWQDLASSGVGVFDLTAPPGPQLAAVCYELGIAMALGVVPIVLSRPTCKVPFDVSVYEYQLDGVHDGQIIGDALDDALCGPPQSQGGTSLRATADEVQRKFLPNPGTLAPADRVLSRETILALSKTADAIEAARLIAYLPTSKSLSLLLPAWPGSYPVSSRIRCFHIMPFNEPWSDAAMRTVEQACEDAQADYVRGDTVPEVDIIQSIWKEIAIASHIVVDMTTFSANVALELGLTHALGRKVLLVGQGKDIEHRLWPSIRKLRVEPYSTQPRSTLLRESIKRFLREPSDACVA